MNIDKQIRIFSILGGVLLVSLGLGLVLPIVFPDTRGTQLVFPNLDKELVNSITITNNDGTYTLSKTGGTWEVQGSQITTDISTELVMEALQLLEKTQTTRMISETGAGVENLGLSGNTQPSKIEIFSTGSQNSLLLTLGKQSTNSADVYAKLGQAPSVWGVESALNDLVARNSTWWIDKNLFVGVREEQVNWLEVGTPETTLRYTKSASGEWSLGQSANESGFSPESIGSLVRQIITLEGDSVEALDEEDLLVLLAPLTKKFTLSLGTDSPRTVELYQAPGLENEQYIVRESSPRRSSDNKILVIRIPNWKVGDLRPR